MIPKFWVVLHENGERSILWKEPLEGLLKWAAGQRIKIFEYELLEQVYPTIEALIDRSSLGTPGAKAIREKTPKSAVDKVLRRADELDSLAKKRQ